MIIIKREQCPKEKESNVTITRQASGESIRLFCSNEEQRDKIERFVIKLFKAENDNITIVNEAGNLVKMVEP